MAKWEQAPLAKPAWEAAPIEFGIDWHQPVEAVRAEIGKLSPDDREDALRQWSDAFVAKERKQGGLLAGVDTVGRTLARGTLVGPYLDEIQAGLSAGVHKLSGGAVGAPYDETVAYQRAQDRAVDTAHPVASFAGKLAGGVAGGGAAIRAVQAGGGPVAPALLAGPAAFMRPAATGVGRIGQAAGIGGVSGGIAGFGDAEGIGNRVEGAAKGAILGTVLGGGIGVAGETVRGVRSAAAGQGQTGAYDRLASQLPEQDVNTFANQVATGAARNTQAIQRRTLDILGEEMERAGQNRGQAVQRTIERIMGDAGVTRQTAQAQIRRLTDVHRDSNLMLSEYPAAAQSAAHVRATRNPADADLREVARVGDAGAHYLIDDLANQSGGQSMATVRNAVQTRNLGMRDAVQGTLDDLAPRAPGGGAPRRIEDLNQMQDGARRTAQLEYQAAYDGPINNTILMGLLPRIVDRHLNRVAGRAGDQAQALRNAVEEFFITRPDGQRLPIMSLQHLQDARGSIRDRIEVARRSGENSIVAMLQPLYRDVTRMMERASPQWARANRRWADNSIDTRARELGEAFALRAGPEYRRQVAEFNRLAPEAQDMVRVEYLQRLSDRLANLGDTHDVAKLFTTDHMRASVRELFGHQGVLLLTQSARDAAIATKSGRMLGNSATAMRLARRADADAETGIMAAAEIGSAHGIRNALLERLTRLLTERRNVPLARIATTPLNDTAEVARHVHNMRAAQAYRRRVQTPTQTPLATSAVTGIAGGDLMTDNRNRLGAR